MEEQKQQSNLLCKISLWSCVLPIVAVFFVMLSIYKEEPNRRLQAHSLLLSIIVTFVYVFISIFAE